LISILAKYLAEKYESLVRECADVCKRLVRELLRKKDFVANNLMAVFYAHL